MKKSFNANSSLNFSVHDVSDSSSPSPSRKSVKYSGFSVRTKYIGAFKERVEPRKHDHENDIHAEKCPWHHKPCDEHPLSHRSVSVGLSKPRENKPKTSARITKSKKVYFEKPNDLKDITVFSGSKSHRSASSNNFLSPKSATSSHRFN